MQYTEGRRWVFPSFLTQKLSPQSPISWLVRAGSPLLALVFPDDCRICGEPLRSAGRVPVCPKCLEAPGHLLPEHHCRQCRTPFLNARPLNADGLCRLCEAGLTRFDAAYSYGDYNEDLRTLIHLFKYNRMRPLAGPLGRLMARALPRDQVFDGLVPMPLHWRKLVSRGFNQSRLLAEEVSRRSGLPVVGALKRRRHTNAQAGLTGTQRRANVAGAFFVPDAQMVRGRRLLLVDDVLTTGATVNAAAAELKRAGAKRLSVLTLARADRIREARAGQSPAEQFVALKEWRGVTE